MNNLPMPNMNNIAIIGDQFSRINLALELANKKNNFTDIKK